jgi:hypothetical protein
MPILFTATLVYGDAASLERVSRLGEDARQTGDTTKVTKSFKQWDGPYLAAFKLDPSTAEVALEGTQRYAVQLVADPDTNQATLQLAESFVGKPAVQKYQIADFVNFIVELPASALTTLAAQEDVISIMPYTEPTLLDERQNQILINSLTAGIPNLSTPYATFLTSKGFPALNSTFTSDFVVDVGDEMVDIGNTVAGSTTPPPGGPPNHTNSGLNTTHFALYRAGDISQPSRLVYAKWESTTFPVPAAVDVRGCRIGHGTLCAHIIAGNIPASLPRALPHAESASPNFYYGLGVAPFVRIGSSAIFGNNGVTGGFTSPNYNDMLARSYQYGARISSNSWGAAVSGAYNTDSQAYDFLVRDAQRTGSVFPTPGNQEMVIVFAAGNSGPGPQTVGSPATAKNVITAGGSQNTRNAGENAQNMYGSSSRGPCADGRRKPEVLALATAVSGGGAPGWHTRPNRLRQPCSLCDEPPPGRNDRLLSCLDRNELCLSGGCRWCGARPAVFPQQPRPALQRHRAQPGNDQGVSDELRPVHDGHGRGRHALVKQPGHGPYGARPRV